MLRESTSEDIGPWKDSHTQFVWYTGSSQWPIPKSTQAFFDKVAAGDPSLRINVPEQWTTTIDPVHGSSPPVRSDGPDLPASFLEVVRQSYSELEDYATRTFRVLRWRGAIVGEHNPIGALGKQWSVDGTTWYPVPEKLVGTGEWTIPCPISNDVRQEIEHLVSDGASEPVGHDLFREAWAQRFHNRRSAVLLGVAAAEVGFKDFVSLLVPNARWLVDSVPSPPIVRMYQEYLPRLPVKLTVKGAVLPPPKFLLDELQLAVKFRNDLAHTGSSPPLPARLQTMLLAIRDLLWILDYHRGCAWAVDHLRQETRQVFLGE